MRNRQKMSFTAVVHITGFDENPHNAIKSVIANVNEFAKLLVVFPGYDPSVPLYKDWPEDSKYLEEHNTEIMIVPKLSVDYVQSDSVMEIAPYCALRPGGIEILRRQMKETPVDVTHFALSPVTTLPDYSPFYGFLVVMQLLNWFRSRIFERGKLYQYDDVRVRHIVQIGKVRHLPERQFVWRYWNTGCAFRLYGGETAIISPPADRTGYDYVMWALYTNSTMCFGWWMLPFVAFLWVPLVLPAYGLLKLNVDSIWILGVWFTEFILSLFITKHTVRMPNAAIYCFLFPVYWILFPFTLIYAKNLVPQRTWRVSSE